MPDTGVKSPTAHNSEDFTNPTNAYSDGSGAATSGTAGQQHQYYDYDFGLSSETVVGILVALDAWTSNDFWSNQFVVELSWDGGSTWTSTKSTGNLTESETTYNLGGASDLWGRSWSASEFSNANFRARIRHTDSDIDVSVSLDWVRVTVYYSGTVDSDSRPAKTKGVGDTYSRANPTSLPTNDDTLATVYDAGEIIDVGTDDGTRVAILGANNFYIHQFEKWNTNNDNTQKITISINVQSSIAPSSKSVLLQIYNRDTSSWETLDTESSAAADTDFDLTGEVTVDVADYYDSLFIVACRVYQNVT